MKSPASVCFFCCHELIGTETGDSPEQSRNNGVFHPKKECGLRNTKGKAKTDLVSWGSVMYWTEASALRQFRAKAFICELRAACMAERFDPSYVKTIYCFFPHKSLKGPQDFSPQKVDCPCNMERSRLLGSVWWSRASSQQSVTLLIISVAVGAILNLYSHIFCKTYYIIPDIRAFFKFIFLLAYGKKGLAKSLHVHIGCLFDVDFQTAQFVHVFSPILFPDVLFCIVFACFIYFIKV